MVSIKKFTQQHFTSLKQHLEKYRKKKDSEHLHKIRVDIKKIKAILNFANDRVKGFKAHKNYIPFRTIFRRAGEIREPEVLSRLLLSYTISGGHDHGLKKNSIALIENFCKDVPSFIHSIDKQWAKLKTVFKKLRIKDVDKYLYKIRKDIKSRLYPKPDMKLIHRVRKSIKAFIYLSAADYRLEKKLKEFYVSEGEAIGELHDLQVFLKFDHQAQWAGRQRPD